MSQAPRRSFAESAEFPRWIIATGGVLVAFILWLAVFSDASGMVKLPGPGSIVYMAVVLCFAVFLIYLARRRAGGRHRR
jgi:hypothetical protein